MPEHVDPRAHGRVDLYCKSGQSLSGHLQHSDVLGLISRQHRAHRVHLALVRHHSESFNLGGLLDHMVVGNNDAIGANHEAAGEAGMPLLAAAAFVEGADHDHAFHRPLVDLGRSEGARGPYGAVHLTELAIEL